MAGGDDRTRRSGFCTVVVVPGSAQPPALPQRRTIVACIFPEEPPGIRYYWLLVEQGEAELCYSDPEDDPDVNVTAESQAFVEWHRGRPRLTGCAANGSDRGHRPRGRGTGPSWVEPPQPLDAADLNLLASTTCHKAIGMPGKHVK